MKIWAFAAIAAASLLSTAAQAAETVTFTINDVTLTAPMPAGYCEPVNSDRLIADTLARGDRDNITLATLIRCDQAGRAEGPGNDYMLIKSPRTALTTMISRPEFLRAINAEFGKADWQTGVASNAATDRAAKGLSDVLETPMEIAGDLAPRGSDQDCAYLGGTLNVNGGGVVYPIILGGCLTSVGNKVLAVYTYDDPGKGGGVAGKMRLARDVAMAIRPVD